MLTSFVQRFPSTWIALFLGGLAAWVYLKYVIKSHTGDVVRDKISNAVLAYVLFSKPLAGLIAHPSINLQEDVLSLLGGAPSYGWLFGVVAAILYLVWSFRRVGDLKRETLAVVAEALLAGATVFFGYLAIGDLFPFQLQDVVRAFGALVILLAVRRWKSTLASNPHRVSMFMGIMLFSTTVLVPQFNRIFLLSIPQWAYAAVIATSLVSEWRNDKRHIASTESNLPPDAQIEEQFNHDEGTQDQPNH